MATFSRSQGNPTGPKPQNLLNVLPYMFFLYYKGMKIR